MAPEQLKPAFPIGLIVPCYRYARELPKTVARIAEFREKSGLALVVCLVDDGSPDETAKTARELEARYAPWCIALPLTVNGGKGRAIREGARRLFGLADFIAFTDCDLYYGLDILTERVLPALRNGADLVILDRSWDRQFHQDSAFRRFVSYAFNHVKTVLTGVTVPDSQAGMKGFRTEFLKAALPVSRIDGFAFDVELLAIALQLRFRVEQIPIRRISTQPEEPGNSSVTLRNALRMLGDLSRIAWDQARGSYLSTALTERVEEQVYKIRDAGHS